MTTEERLARLERDNRWLRLFAVGCVLGLGCWGFMAADNNRNLTADTLFAQRICVVDKDNHVIARWEQGAGKQTQISASGIKAAKFILSDDAGKDLGTFHAAGDATYFRVGHRAAPGEKTGVDDCIEFGAGRNGPFLSLRGGDRVFHCDSRTLGFSTKEGEPIWNAPQQ